MFIYGIWENICQELSKHKTIRVDEILSQKDDAEWIVVKHDIETNVSKALELAKIEASFGIRATYFVQANLLRGNVKKLKEIQALGHEVTYHYDVLDANNGNYMEAINDFAKNIKEFSAFGFEVKTVCPHGNPMIIRDGWSSNKDFFKDEVVVSRFLNILDIVVQLPKKLRNTYIYISDAGYGWKQIVNIQDNDTQNSGDIALGDHQGLLKIIKNQERVILSTHPHRWERSRIKALFNLYRFKILRTVARKLSSVSFLKKIMSRFYFLAKKV